MQAFLRSVILVIICFKNKKSWVLVAHTCNPTYLVAEIGSITILGQPGKIFHKIPSLKQPWQGWWSGSSGRVPA
jgi:hypothetical protein